MRFWGGPPIIAAESFSSCESQILKLTLPSVPRKEKNSLIADLNRIVRNSHSFSFLGPKQS